MGREASETHDSSEPEKKVKTRKNLKKAVIGHCTSKCALHAFLLKQGEAGGGGKPALQEKGKKASSALLEIPESPFVESLLVCKAETKGGVSSGGRLNRECSTPSRPSIGPVPESSVLGRLREFLPAMKAANDQLAPRAADGNRDLDIEVITGGEDAPHILMDVALGVAELRTPEAVAAAERALKGAVAVAAPIVDIGSDESSEDESDEEESGDESHGELLLRKEDEKGSPKPKQPKIQEL